MGEVSLGVDDFLEAKNLASVEDAARVRCYTPMALDTTTPLPKVE